MEFNLTAKDKHALKSLSRDLPDMFSMKKVEDRLEDPDPEYRKVFGILSIYFALIFYIHKIPVMAIVTRYKGFSVYSIWNIC
jgi:hypothetical protein